jgi:hypothetical protein
MNMKHPDVKDGKLMIGLLWSQECWDPMAAFIKEKVPEMKKEDKTVMLWRCLQRKRNVQGFFRQIAEEEEKPMLKMMIRS